MSTSLNQTLLTTSIPWVPCFSDRETSTYNITWQCANITVPLDYRNNSQTAITQIGMAKARPNELKSPMGTVSLAFAAGTSSIFEFDTDTALPRVLEFTNRQYDLLLVDARGTGWSRPITCGYTNDSLVSSFNSFRDGERSIEVEGSDITTESLTNQFEYYDSHPLCPPDAEDPEYLAHVNTPNLARDLDFVRNLMGLDTLDFFGFEEGGSILGATYAVMFPDTVGKIVLDATAHFPYWMGIEGNALDYHYDRNTNIPRILGEFAAQCAAAGTANPKFCPFASASMQSPDPEKDILDRISYITGNLTQQSYSVQTTWWADGTYTFSDFALSLPSLLSSTSSWYMVAKILLKLETVIQQTNTPASHRTFKRSEVTTNNNLAFSSFNRDSLISGSSSIFAYPAVFCLDSNFNNIDSVDQFVQYISTQIDENAIVGYSDVNVAMCLAWPNLAAYDVERYRSPSPPILNNKLLVIGRLYEPQFSYSGALATYEYLGSDNANFIIHGGYGDDPNDCIDEAIKAYFVEGTFPENGTLCLLDYTGSSNVFLFNFRGEVNSLKTKLVLGLGLGFSIPLLIGLLFLFWFGYVRRRNVRRNAPRFQVRPQTVSEIHDNISLKDFKDTRFFVNKESI